MKPISTWRFTFLAAIGLLAGTPSSSHAGLLPVNVTVNADGGNYRYAYGVVLTSDSILRTGDYFTIYDFDGLVANSNVQPTGFTFTSANLGATPAGILPTDSAAIANLTFTYTGPDTVVGQTGIGNFIVKSTYGSSTEGVFSARTHRQIDGKTDANITETEVPVPTAPGVPEPGTLALMAIGLPLIGAFRHLRRRI